jgi:histidinol-phosphatase
LSGDPRLREELLAFAHELADAADALTLPAFRQAHEPTTKPDGSAVTHVDLAVERELRERIESAWPDHGVLGEEYGQTTVDAEVTWYLDPIDGTNNFIRGVPAWATLICAEIGGEPAAAVVAAPALGSRWDGLVGVGARRDGHPVRVADTRTLAGATVSFGGLNWFDAHGGTELIGRLTSATRRQRSFGDFWHHCLVADGSIDVAIEAAVSAWDLAAVRCIVRAAGGSLTDFTGADRIDGGTAISVATPELRDALLELIRG